MTEKISKLLSSTATGVNNLNPTATELSVYEQDALFSTLSDLVNPQFRPWYCSTFKRIGHHRAMELASLARVDGKDPRKYFSFLLRKEVYAQGS